MGPARRSAALVCGLVCAMLAGCGSGPAQTVPGGTPSPRPSPGTESFNRADVQRAVDDLAKLGIETRVRPSDAAPITPATGDRSVVRLLRFQVRNLALERAAGGGTRGTDLDALSAAGGGGPVSALVAGWAVSAQTPAARWAASLFAQKRTTDPAAGAFPTLALVAFVADASGSSRQATDRRSNGLTTAILRGSGGTGLGTSAMLTVAKSADFCSEVSAYLSAALDDIVDANADPPAWLKGLIDLYAPQYTNDPGLLRRTIGAIALMTYATSLARAWTVNLVPDPLAVAYGIEGEDPVEGEIQLIVWSGKDVFADEVADCASLADAQLASIPVEGSSVIWDASGLGVHAKEATAEPKLDENGGAGLAYKTATESKDDAQNGDPVTAQMGVNAWVDRAEMASLAAVVKSILLGDAAGTPAGSTARALYQTMKPTLDVVMRPSGFALIDVTYHTPKASAIPSASPSAPPEAPTAAPARRYDCAKLISAAEIAAAWGVSVKFIGQLFGTDTYGPPESTSCSFATKVGPPPYMEVAVNVHTGQAVALYQQAIFSAPGVVALSGIGDRTAFVQSGNTAAAGAMVRGVLIIVEFRSTTPDGGAPVPNAKAAAETILRLIAGRV